MDRREFFDLRDKDLALVSVNKGDSGCLYDANGDEIEHAISAELKSGLVLQYVTDRSGRYVVKDTENPYVERVYRKYPAPLCFVRRDGGIK
jgi:hypothetical protein